jgi:hypothetical protein
MRFWTVNNLMMQSFGALVGAGAGFCYSAIPAALLDLIAKFLFSHELNLVSFLSNSPLLVGFFCCLGAHHIGKERIFTSGDKA